MSKSPTPLAGRGTIRTARGHLCWFRNPPAAPAPAPRRAAGAPAGRQPLRVPLKPRPRGGKGAARSWRKARRPPARPPPPAFSVRARSLRRCATTPHELRIDEFGSNLSHASFADFEDLSWLNPYGSNDGMVDGLESDPDGLLSTVEVEW